MTTRTMYFTHTYDHPNLSGVRRNVSVKRGAALQIQLQIWSF